MLSIILTAHGDGFPVRYTYRIKIILCGLLQYIKQ